jgi:hypothetical protein
MDILKNAVMALTTKPALAPETSGSVPGANAELGIGPCEFIAMEYYGLILNRTYFVVATKESLAGVRVGGLVASPPMARQELINPRHYLGDADLSLVHGILNQSRSTSRSEHGFFNYPWSIVNGFSFNDKPKWGMGNVPYSGRLFLVLADGRQRELILLGKQDGPNLLKQLNTIRVTS